MKHMPGKHMDRKGIIDGPGVFTRWGEYPRAPGSKQDLPVACCLPDREEAKKKVREEFTIRMAELQKSYKGRVKKYPWEA